jgi:hypothetical protein
MIDQQLIQALMAQRRGVTTGAARAQPLALRPPRAAAPPSQAMRGPTPLLHQDVEIRPLSVREPLRPPPSEASKLDLPTGTEIAAQRKATAAGLAEPLRATAADDTVLQAIIPPSLNGVEAMNGPGGRRARRASRAGTEAFIGAARTGDDEETLTHLKDRLHRWFAGRNGPRF